MSSPPYPGPAEPMLLARLRLASERGHAVLFARLRELGYGDIRPAHLALFQFPGPHGARPIELAARLGTTKQALNPLLNDLERFGYMQRRPDTGDKRGRVLWLTERGLAFAGAIKAILMEIEEEWRERFGERRLAALKEMLRVIAEEWS